MDTMLRIVNDKGRPFNVRLVRQGERYGRLDCLTHNEADPLVEFLDASRAQDGERGYFVSRYYVSTLRDRRRRYMPETREWCEVGIDTVGLCLDGAYAEIWSVDGAALREVLAWLDREVS